MVERVGASEQDETTLLLRNGPADDLAPPTFGQAVAPPATAADAHAQAPHLRTDPIRRLIVGRGLAPLVLVAASVATFGAGRLMLRARRRTPVNIAGVTSAFELSMYEASMDAYVKQYGGGNPYEFKCPVPDQSAAEQQPTGDPRKLRGRRVEASGGGYSFTVSGARGFTLPTPKMSGSISIADYNSSLSPTMTPSSPPTVAPPLVTASPAEVAVEANSSDQTLACCGDYDRSGWPYVFPQCASNRSRCPSCWNASRRGDLRAKHGRAAGLVALAWAASSAVQSNTSTKKVGVATKLENWVQDGFDKLNSRGEDARHVSHGMLDSHSMRAHLYHGLQKHHANLCPEVDDWDELTLTDEDHNIHAVAYKSEKQKIALVVFRGTQMGSLKNWEVDTNIGRVELSLGKHGPTTSVHQGFLMAVDRVLPRVRKWIEGYVFGIFGGVSENWRLAFAGHSLGGALATLASTMAEVQDWDRKPDVTITFGAPRVADRVLSQWWEENNLCPKLLRMNVYNDPVHWLPNKMVSGIAQAATEIGNCVSDISNCLFGEADKSEKPVEQESWVHVCREQSEFVIPGAMRGVNPEESDMSPFGGAQAHYLSNCLFGYGYGVLHSEVVEADEYCGIGPSLCSALSGTP